MPQTQTNETKNDRKKTNMTVSEKKGNGEPGGRITLSEDVVATIAGLAAREIDGIYDVGKPRLIAFGDSPTRGVDVEVGNIEAAVDLDIVMEYGADIEKVAGLLRDRIAKEVAKMAGRNVIEVNIHVADVHLPEPETPKSDETPRVR